MRLTIAASIAVAAALGIASAAGAGPALTDHGPGRPVQYMPPGPCGYGRVQKLACEIHNHPPAKPTKTCKKVCVPA